MIVGITGGFGSGKSTVARFFGGLGVYVIDADKLAHKALRKNSPVYPRIVKQFQQACDQKGNIDRKKLARLVFTNPRGRKKLEALIHPYVFDQIRRRIDRAKQAVVVIEVPLLYESGFDRFCHKTVAVSTPAKGVVERLKQKGYTPEEIKFRQKAQLPAKEKMKRSDFVVDNSGNYQQTRREVKRIWRSLRPVFQKEMTKDNG